MDHKRIHDPDADVRPSHRKKIFEMAPFALLAPTTLVVFLLPVAKASCPCPALLPPAAKEVCASDRRTYASMCHLECAALPGLSLLYSGPCSSTERVNSLPTHGTPEPPRHPATMEVKKLRDCFQDHRIYPCTFPYDHPDRSILGDYCMRVRSELRDLVSAAPPLSPPPPAPSLRPASPPPPVPPAIASVPAERALSPPKFENLLYEPNAEKIIGFKHEYSFLSHLYPCQVQLNGITYASLEHALQASKASNPHNARFIAEEPDPAQVRHRLAFTLLRNDWNFVKFEILMACLRSKFAPPSPLAAQLLATGDKMLLDDSDFDDLFGKDGNINSENPSANILGFALMTVRSELRPPPPPSLQLPVPSDFAPFPNTSKFIECQQRDPNLSKIIQSLLARDNSPAAFFHYVPKFRIKNGLLVTNTKVPRTVVPSKLVPLVLQNFHDLTVHSGIKILQMSISLFYFWHNMYSDIEEYVRSCTLCGQFKATNQKFGLLHPRSANDIFDDVMIDYCHVFTQKNGFTHCLLVCDIYSNHCSLFPCKTTSAPELIKHLKTYFSRFGVPRTLHSDVCSAVKSEAFKQFSEQCHFQVQLAASGAHWSVGAVESNVKRFSTALKFLINSKLPRMKNWASYVPFVEFHMNNSPQIASKLSPNDIVFGKRFNTPLVNKSVLPSSVSLRRRFQILYEIRRQATKLRGISKQNSKQIYDQNRKSVKFERNERVLIWFERKASKLSPVKLQKRYRFGTIVRKLSNVLYYVRMKTASKTWVRLCHVAHIKKIQRRPSHLELDDNNLLWCDVEDE
ncbi:hypothetical protein FOCC_FOCC012435, partial [Frankliniella occidentalis]